MLLIGTNHTFQVDVLGFRVNLENCYSDRPNISYFVAQKSILGPLLLLIFVNDIAQMTDSILINTQVT